MGIDRLGNPGTGKDIPFISKTPISGEKEWNQRSALEREGKRYYLKG